MIRVFSTVSEVAKAFALAKADVAPLYVCRRVLNADTIIRWFKLQAFGQMVSPEDMHVTVCFSREPVSWQTLAPGDQTGMRLDHDFRHRELDAFGKSREVAVMKFKSDQLQARHSQFRSLGASWDYPSYEPHLTLSYNAPGKLLDYITPYNGPILFGPEEFHDINTDKEFIEKSFRRQ